MAKDGTVLNWVVHHFLVPCPEAHEIGISLRLILCPLFTPYWFAIRINRHNLRKEHPLGMCQVEKNGSF